MQDITKMVGKEYYLPLLPRHGIYLTRAGHADEERFARVFRGVWKRIPLRARRTILRRWRTIRARHGRAAVMPQIQVLDRWENWEDLSDDGTAFEPEPPAVYLGQCWVWGHSLYFHAKIVDALPADHLGTLIAHELAHIVLPTIVNGYCDMSHLEVECCIHDLVMGWGFDQDAFFAWMNSEVDRQ